MEQSTEGAGAFACAIIGWLLFGVLCVVGFFMGLGALSRARSRGQQPNGLATAAVWVGGIGAIIKTLVWILVIGGHMH
ncbi:MAG: hypothetical protein ACREJ2_06700 [Planctomycetota bacterium]